jgi:RNA polymerase sigma factor (TIGR02999 family)
MDQLIAIDSVYNDLMIIARAELARHQRGQTLNTRALVNEAYLKLFGGSGAVDFDSRKHFFASAAQAMRQVVIDYARARMTARRGSGAAHVALDDLDDLHGSALPIDAQAEQLLAVDAAMQKLSLLDPRLVRVVELRFFAGLEVRDIAELLEVSEPTIKRDTRAAKAFLQRELMA